jgi:MFS family permease
LTGGLQAPRSYTGSVPTVTTPGTGGSGSPRLAPDEPLQGAAVTPVGAPGRAAEADGPPASRLRQTFVALEERDFRIFWLGQLVSVTGTWMQTVAQGWLVLTLPGGSPFMLGLAAAVRSLPVLLLALPAGFIADRFDRRVIVLCTTTVATIASGALGILTIAGLADITTVLVLAGVLGVTNAFEMPARQSYVSELAGKRNLANAIALNSLLFNSARVVGPAIAGILVAIVGPGWAFLLNSVTYLAVIAGLLLIRRVHVPRLGVAARSAVPEVVAYLRSEPRVTMLFALLAAQTIFASGQFILAPSLAQDLGQGAEGLGVLLAASGAGAVVGGLRLAATAGRSSHWRLLLASGIALAAGLAGIGLVGSASYPMTLLCFVIAGWGTVTFNASSNTLLQTITPDRLRGRIMSLYTVSLLGLMPFGGLLLGSLADQLNSAQAVGIGGIVYGAVVALGFTFSRALRRL